MKMNVDCIRSVLEYIIESQTVNDKLQVIPVKTKELYDSKDLEKFTKQDILYSLYLLNDGEYIKCLISNYDNETSFIEINQVTYKGHMFYETVREPTVWEKTKDIIKKAGNHTLEFVEQVAHDAAVESIKAIVSNT
ncbi:MAG: DUF2513 domain-containing protein [Huintestinicola sp.]